MSTLIRPVITEKSMLLASRGVYTFVVAKSASKHQVREAVQGLFGVTVTDIHTSVSPENTKRTGRLRIKSTTPGKKIARVSLKQGQSIDLFDLKEEN